MEFRLTNPQGDYDSNRFLTNLFIELQGKLPNTINSHLRVDYKKFTELVHEAFGTPNIQNLMVASYFDMEAAKVTPGLKYLGFNDNKVILYAQSDTKKKKQFCTYVNIHYDASQEASVQKLLKSLVKFSKKERKTNKIHVVVEEGGSLSLKSFEIKKPKFSLEDNYDNIGELHRDLIKRLNTKGDKGIALFYGEPGCGKTNYIRYLLATIKKTVIYLPPDMAGHISSPSFIPFLMNYPNSVLVIEDAENIIKKRESGGSQSISNLLNLGDGLLSDILSIQIVGTFNCNYKEIDEALLRKGRLICKHEFGKLSIEKAQKLSNKLKFTTTIMEPMTLSDIYNQDEKDYKSIRKSIGFSMGAKKNESLGVPIANPSPVFYDPETMKPAK